VTRGPIRLFKYVALLGCGLSAAGLALAVGLRIDFVFKRIPGGPNSWDGALQILDAFKEAGATFLLSSILYVVCEIALQTSRRDPDEYHD
jgi:hypothetical protein